MILQLLPRINSTASSLSDGNIYRGDLQCLLVVRTGISIRLSLIVLNSLLSFILCNSSLAQETQMQRGKTNRKPQSNGSRNALLKTMCSEAYYELFTNRTLVLLAKKEYKAFPEFALKSEREREATSQLVEFLSCDSLVDRSSLSLSGAEIFDSLPLVQKVRNHREDSASLQNDISVPSFHRWVVLMIETVTPALSHLLAPMHGY